jgi:hypothetical protein
MELSPFQVTSRRAASVSTHLTSGCLLNVANSDHLIIGTLFPRLREAQYTGRVKRFAVVSQIFTQALFQLVFRKTTSPVLILQAPKKDESWRVLNWNCPHCYIVLCNLRKKTV